MTLLSELAGWGGIFIGLLTGGGAVVEDLNLRQSVFLQEHNGTLHRASSVGQQRVDAGLYVQGLRSITPGGQPCPRRL